MNLLSCLPRLSWPRAAGALGAEAQLAAQTGPGAAPADHDAPCGCGWFDSSHELQQGLLVCEHTDPGALAVELPLGPWLDLQLSSWRPVLVA